MDQKTKKTVHDRRDNVLSPGTLVMKRFTRNRLAVIGVIIIAFMFIFSFLGGIISPYSQSQVFRTTEHTYKDYAGVTENTEQIYSEKENAGLDPMVKADMILAINEEKTSFKSGDTTYSLLKEGDSFYQVAKLKPIAGVIKLGNLVSITPKNNETVTDAFKHAFTQADKEGRNTFVVDGQTYYVTKEGRELVISCADILASASKLIFNTYSKDTTLSFAFKVQAEMAMVTNQTSFELDGKTYEVIKDEVNNSAVFKVDGTDYASASTFNVRAIANDVFLTVEFKSAVQAAVKANQTKFTYAEDGVEETYEITRKNTQYTVRKSKETQVNAAYQSPSKAHWMGTDGNGMDMLTRLMYGGRISLLIGFIVVFFEIILGIAVGGVSGYFGGWVDSICMRMVDIFNCIPSLPLYIILGAIMDFLKVAPRLRIYFLCIILAALSWPKVARMVRAQILSLREQEFMIATEATGIRTSRRIFKHLIPNVIPQLIVIATMGLGDVILTEAALSFLGLGVKYPLASWGNIINAVNDIYIMTNYLFVWVPAGILILVTVLGFNFIGDGLRDAFDPKMKR